MRWPWCSIALLDAVTAERDEWKALALSQVDHQNRLERKANAMSEVPKDKREPVQKMPQRLRQHILDFQSGPTRDEEERDIWNLYKETGDWAQVEREKLGAAPVDEEEDE